jgi:hypothetical protein
MSDPMLKVPNISGNTAVAIYQHYTRVTKKKSKHINPEDGLAMLVC